MALGFVPGGGDGGGQSYGFQWFGDRVAEAVHNQINARLHRTGQEVVQVARGLAPVDTGRLQDSIAYFVYGMGTQQTLQISVGVPYGIYQEFGTRNMPAHPYIRPALNAVGRIWGADVVMDFYAVPQANPLKAHGAGFEAPVTLNARQRGHVRENLVPTSGRLHRGNTKRATLRVRRTPL